MYIRIELFSSNEKTIKRFEKYLKSCKDIEFKDRWRGDFLIQTHKAGNLNIELPCKGRIIFNYEQHIQLSLNPDGYREQIKKKLSSIVNKMITGFKKDHEELIDFCNKRYIAPTGALNPRYFKSEYEEFKKQRKNDYKCINYIYNLLMDSFEVVKDKIKWQI